jgi:hypothetical protein
MKEALKVPLSIGGGPVPGEKKKVGGKRYRNSLPKLRLARGNSPSISTHNACELTLITTFGSPKPSHNQTLELMENPPELKLPAIIPENSSRYNKSPYRVTSQSPKQMVARSA